VGLTRRPSTRCTSFVPAFAGGAMLLLSFGKLLPEGAVDLGRGWATAFFVAGVPGLPLAVAPSVDGITLTWYEGRLAIHAVTPSRIGLMLPPGRPPAVVEAGILVLPAVPVVRLLVVIAVLARDRDLCFVAAAITVAALLTLGLLLGRI
jgi:uncharacterized membrane protein